MKSLETTIVSERQSGKLKDDLRLDNDKGVQFLSSSYYYSSIIPILIIYDILLKLTCKMKMISNSWVFVRLK